MRIGTSGRFCPNVVARWLARTRRVNRIVCKELSRVPVEGVDLLSADVAEQER
jgi:hypothetical protein